MKSTDNSFQRYLALKRSRDAEAGVAGRKCEIRREFISVCLFCKVGNSRILLLKYGLWINLGTC